MKKHEKYLAALNSFPIERTLGSMITTKQMLRYFLTTCAGMVTLVAVQPDGKGRMVSMGSNRSEFYSTTAVGESLAKIVAASDHVVACYSPTSAVIVLRNMVASRVFHDIAMSVARTAKKHEKEGDASFYDDVSRIRSEFVDEFVISATRLNEYIGILNMMHRHMDQVDNAHFKRYALSAFGEQSGYARKAFDEIGGTVDIVKLDAEPSTLEPSDKGMFVDHASKMQMNMARKVFSRHSDAASVDGLDATAFNPNHF